VTTFTAAQLDLSRLPPFRLVEVDEAAETTALKAGIVARFIARGVPYDVENLRTDTAMILAEEVGYRKTLSLAALNDAGRRLSLSYGHGAALDHLAASYYASLGLRRLPLVAEPRPFATHPEDWESDERFKLRIALAPEAMSPGTLGGYEYWALTAAPHLKDALALNHASGLVPAGTILVVLLGRDPDPNPQTAKPHEEEPAQVGLASAALRDRSVKLGSDTLLVRAAKRVPVARSYTLGIRPGPDPALVLAEARRRYAAFLADRRNIGKLLPESLEKRELGVSGVEYVHAGLGSGTDVDPGIDGVINVTTLTLVPEIVDG
jgi:phage-related baseplate assembly protein